MDDKLKRSVHHTRMTISSEDAKNWITCLAIVGGALWGLFEYYELKAQRTTANIEASTALAPRVSASMEVEVIGFNGPEPSNRTNLPRCVERQADLIRTVPLETRAALQVTSVMTATIELRVTEISISRMRPYRSDNLNLSNSEISKSLEQPTIFQISKENLLTGRLDRVLEPGETNTFYFSGYVPFPFDCAKINSGFGDVDEFAIRLNFEMVTTDPKKTISGNGKHTAFVVCTVSYSANRSCSNWEPNQAETLGRVMVPPNSLGNTPMNRASILQTGNGNTIRFFDD